MAIIKCPKCGKDVSDKAKACPNCNYNIEKHTHEVEKCSLKQKIKVKSIKIQGTFKEELIFCTIFVMIVILFMFIPKQIHRNKMDQINIDLLYSHIRNISEYKTYAVMKTSDGRYIYHEAGKNSAIVKIRNELSQINICVEYIDERYLESPKAIDEKLKSGTWKEYREILNKRYYIDQNIDNEEKAKKIISEYVDTMVD